MEGGCKFLSPRFSVRGAGKGELAGASAFPTSCHLWGQVAVGFLLKYSTHICVNTCMKHRGEKRPLHPVLLMFLKGWT